MDHKDVVLSEKNTSLRRLHSMYVYMEYDPYIMDNSAYSTFSKGQNIDM